MDLYDSFVLGGDIEYLKNVEEVRPIVKERKERPRELSLARIFRRVRESLVDYEIDGPLLEETDRWMKRIKREYKAGETLRKAEAKELSEDASKWEAMIWRPLLERPIVELTRKGALNPKALLATSNREPSSLFEVKIWKNLPSVARSDFCDAARCLLVEASTPASMVALRGFEALVREYYRLKIGKESGKKALGFIIRELRKVPDINTRLLGYIDYIRSEKRNLAQHPDKIFTQKEAERIFMEIIDVVHNIYAEM